MKSIVRYHDEEPISYSSLRGGISQITEKGDVTASFLLIQVMVMIVMMVMMVVVRMMMIFCLTQEARIRDSGTYACHASVGNISSVTVHVFKSEYLYRANES